MCVLRWPFLDRTLGPKGTSWEGENSRYWTEVSKESGATETSRDVEGGDRVEAGEVQDLELDQEER